MKSLFLTFFRIGLFTIGGGYAMIPLIEAEVVNKRQWIDRTLFTDLIAVAQSCPGVFAINISIFIGYRLRGVPGAIVTALGTALPSLIIILAIAMFFRNFQNVPWVAAMFAGIRPAVVALLAIPTWNMTKSAGVSLINCWIPVASAMLIWLLGVNPIYIILAAGLGGYLYGQFLKPSE
ncbi:MAG: chromate transporter [Prevotellaceae bacterium]|nr:chromate transporter [Prevotellaceae bacterium]MDO4932891.1 chromate transporter [Prevotellaceae bacterium]